jgi:GNAT superfamily N-acetyltransferase
MIFKNSINMLVIFAFILSTTEQASSFYNITPDQNHLRAPATTAAKEATQYDIKTKLIGENIKSSSAGHLDWEHVVRITNYLRDGLLTGYWVNDIPALEYIISDNRYNDIGKKAGYALSKIGAPAIPALISLLRNDRGLNGLVFSEMGPAAKDAVPDLILLLESADDSIRLNADIVRAIGAIGPAAKDAVPALARALDIENSNLMWYVYIIEALEKIGFSALPALMLALGNKDDRIRESAVSALIDIGPPARDEAISFLEALKGKRVVKIDSLLSENVVADNNLAAFGRTESDTKIPVSLERCIAQRGRKGIKSYGSKAIRLGEMIKLGLPVPVGIVIPIDATDKTINDSIDAIISYFEERHQGKLGDKKNPVKLSVRSSPVHSMPGLLFTETDVDSRQKLVEAIEKVRLSWQSPPADKINDAKGTGVIIQIMVYGDQNNNSASGVVFTRDIVTGEDKLSGRFAVQQKGSSVVSRSNVKTRGMDDFKTKFPAAFDELDRIKKTLEKKYYYPQEIEFVIEDGKLWILQSRNAEMFPGAETKVVIDMVNAGIISQFRMSTIMMATQHKLQNKPLLKLKNKLGLQKIVTGIPSAPGAAMGEVVFSMARVADISAQGKIPILFAFMQPEEIKYAILKGDIGGIVACHGHDALHESVLAKKQGVPFVDGLSNAIFSNNILKIGRHKLQEGTPVIIDGTTGDIYLAPKIAHSSLFEYSHSVSILGQDFDIGSIEKQAFEQYSGYTYDQLIKLHTSLVIMLKGFSEVTLESVLDSIRAHVIHKLIFEKAVSKSERDILLDLQAEMESRVGLIESGINLYIRKLGKNTKSGLYRDKSILVDFLEKLRLATYSKRDTEYILETLCGPAYKGNNATSEQLKRTILKYYNHDFDLQQIEKVVRETNCTEDGYRVLRRPLIEFLGDFGGKKELKILSSCPRMVSAWFYIGTYTVDGADVERAYYIRIGTDKSTDFHIDDHPDSQCEDPLWEDIQKAKEKIQARLAKKSHKTSSAGSLDNENPKQAEYLAEEAYLSHARSIGKEEERIIEFIKDKAGKEFGADTDVDKKAHLDNLIRDVERPWDERADEEAGQYELLQELLSQPVGVSGHIDLTGKKLNAVKITTPVRDQGAVILPGEGILYVVGDTHGDSVSTRRIIDTINFRERVEKGEDIYLVFLGDYVNNGLDSVGNLITVLELQKEFPNRVILLSGNHEFRETYMTAIKECYKTHWDNATNRPFDGKNTKDGTHYGHIRFELISKFGVTRGEEIYRLFENWGRNLPYICFSTNGLMMSHSIGLPEEYLNGSKQLCLKDLAFAKEDPADIQLFKDLGYEAWKATAKTGDTTVHALMVNNRKITSGLLGKFQSIGVQGFMVGHTHSMSGNIEQKGRLITLCSSDMYSPTAGHYMYQEMRVEEKRLEEPAPYYLEIDLLRSAINDATKHEINVKSSSAGERWHYDHYLDVIVEAGQALDDGMIRSILQLEKNINKGRRIPDPVLMNFLRDPDSVVVTATDTKTGEVVGYIFGLPQTLVPETNFSRKGAEAAKTFYEMSWQVLPSYQGSGIGTMLRRQFRDEVRNKGYLYLATHQHDLYDKNALETELLNHYAQDDELYELRRHLPPPQGIKDSQQYVVIKLAQPVGRITSIYKYGLINRVLNSAA